MIGAYEIEIYRLETLCVMNGDNGGNRDEYTSKGIDLTF